MVNELSKFNASGRVLTIIASVFSWYGLNLPFEIVAINRSLLYTNFESTSDTTDRNKLFWLMLFSWQKLSILSWLNKMSLTLTFAKFSSPLISWGITVASSNSLILSSKNFLASLNLWDSSIFNSFSVYS